MSQRTVERTTAVLGCTLGSTLASAEEAKPLGKGVASWYGPGFHGKKTAHGERFNTNDLTADWRMPRKPGVLPRPAKDKALLFRANMVHFRGDERLRSAPLRLGQRPSETPRASEARLRAVLGSATDDAI